VFIKHYCKHPLILLKIIIPALMVLALNVQAKSLTVKIKGITGVVDAYPSLSPDGKAAINLK
jgi:hypothetical protein